MENEENESISAIDQPEEVLILNSSPENQGSSWITSVFLVVNAALGAGLLNFPAAYHQSGGLVVAISMQAVLIFFIIGSLLILTYCSDIGESSSYQDVVYFMCGKNIQIISAVGIVLYCFGTCITFFVVIGDQWDKFLTFAYGASYCDYWFMNRKFTMSITSVILVLPLCFPKRIDFLKYASGLGVVAIVYCVSLVTFKYFLEPIYPGPIRTRPNNWTDVFRIVPVICFGYQCHLSIVPIYSCMKKRTLKEFSKTLLVSMAICLFAYTGTASFGYLTFGANVNPDVLLSYDQTTDVLIAVVLIAVKMYTTYPILLFVGRTAIESIWISARSLSADDIVAYERMRRIVTVLVWFVTSLLIAIVVPNIGDVISLLGGLAALFAFMFPGLALLQTLLMNSSPSASHVQLQSHVQSVPDHVSAPESHVSSQSHVECSQDKSRTLGQLRYYFILVCCVFYIVIGVFIFGLVTTQSLMSDVMGISHSTRPVHTSICE